jgi:hypothetical protein
MRMRLFELLQAALGAFRYGPSVSCQKIGIYLDESLANNRDKVSHPDAQGRRTHNGHVVHSCGISNKKVCVECCAYDLGDEYAILCGRGRPEDGKLTDALSGIVGSLWVATDDHAGYARVALLAWGLQAHGERGEEGRASLASSMRCSEGCTSSCFSSMGSSTKWLGHLSCLLPVDRAGKTF